jgi:N-acetylglutamate synthase-like GNAT family acetyltransferase
MNVTLKLPDEMVREARHLAINENSSLSAIVSELLDARLKARRHAPQKAPNLAESLLLPDEPEWFAQTGFPLLNRDVVPLRGTPFRFERDPEE